MIIDVTMPLLHHATAAKTQTAALIVPACYRNTELYSLLLMLVLDTCVNK